MARHYIDTIDYVKKEQIGSGAFGEVYKVFVEKTKATYAVKEIKCGSNDDLNSALSELRQLGTVNHPNIVGLVNAKAEQSEPFQAIISLLIEYCPGRDLNHRLARPSSSRLNRQWMLEIANAVEYLHKRKIIHRDLKPHNILLTGDEHVKVADFGLAARFRKKTEQQTWLNYYFDDGCGAACYIAPELIQEPIHYNYKVDIFATGVIFYAILERTFLKVNGKKLYGVYCPGKPDQPLGIHMFNIKRDVDISFTERNTGLTNMIKQMLTYDYKKRPNIEAVKTAVERSQKWCILM